MADLIPFMLVLFGSIFRGGPVLSGLFKEDKTTKSGVVVDGNVGMGVMKR